ncbi:ankycorbin isoform X3 [Folsomia candida]|uniref:ankycorbin isoform X3 n=1 Tax=Folsomia candida TaxID=158441 RepID=UPI0016053C0B|nr:ankycorbin isoform X3 [Folsomia candida]
MKQVHKAQYFVGSGDAILLLVNAGGKVDAEDKDGLTTIHCAASRGHTDCLETLIGLCGAEVDVIDNNGCTALFYSVTLGHADCTELLLNYGAEPNRQDRKGRTPGHCGAAKGQLETLKLLTKHGANLWLRNVRGDLPLHEAVLSRRKDLVMWLLSLRNESVNTPNNDGKCPIHLAAISNNVEMVKILIDHRADVNLLMRSGKGTAMTPLDAALVKGNSAVAKFLQLHGGLPSNSLNNAALHRRLNRSIEGQISPASSHLGSHHHPSPDDHHQRTFVSPDVFDHSISATPFPRSNEFSKAGSHRPPFATSTPIMDDGVQTDEKYLRDIEVQVSDSFEEKGGKSGESSTGHRISERRRHRKSRSQVHHDRPNSGSTSNASSPDRSSNQLTSRTSRKSSRKSLKGSGSKSDSRSRTSNGKAAKDNEETIRNQEQQSSEGEKVTQQSPTPQREPPPMTPQESSDTPLDHDNTLMSEKFSELDNGGVHSSETDAREEELDQPNNAEVEAVEFTAKTSDLDTENQSREDVERKSKSPERVDVSRSSRSKSKSREKSGSPPQKPLRNRSASAKSAHEGQPTSNQSLDNKDRSRSASANSDASSSRRRQASAVTNEVEAAVPLEKSSAVSWNDKEQGKRAHLRNRSKSATDRERRSRSKSKGKDGKVRDRSKSALERGEKSNSKSGAAKVAKPKVSIKKDETIERKASPQTKHEKIPPQPNVDVKEAEESNSKSEATISNTQPETEENPIYDEIEAGKRINLQEAARRRSESLASDPSRSRSVSIPRHTCEPNIKGIVHGSSKYNRVTKIRRNGKVTTTSEEREIQLQEALLASSNKLRPNKKKAPSSTLEDKGKRSIPQRQSLAKSRAVVRKSSEEHELRSNSTVIDSGFSDHRGMTSEELRTRPSPQGKPSVSVKRRVVTRRPGSGQSQQRKSIFSSSPKQYRNPNSKNSRFDTLIVHQMSIENGVLEDEMYSTSTRGSVTSEDTQEQFSPRRKKTNYSRPRSRLTFSRNDNVRDPAISPRLKKGVDVETPISVTQAMQASMRKYNLERMIFHELLELKRVQMRAGKANEQLLVKRLAENYKRAGFSVNFRDFEGPFTFRNFEKYLYDQLRLLQNNRKVLPRFAPSDDVARLSTALKKMNSAKLPYLDDAERSESVCDNIQCSHTTHRCHHAAHAYTGVPCVAYIGNRKPTFLPRVNPLKAPGPTQKDKNATMGGSRLGADAMNLNSPVQISISPRTDTQSPITLEVQQGSNTQVFTLPTKTLDPSKNYYVSLSIKPNPISTSPTPPSSENFFHRPTPDVVDDGSISAPPPPVFEVQPDVEREKHNRSM